MIVAATVTIATLTALAIYNAISTRIGVGAAAGHQLVDLARGTADLARQVAEMGRRLAAMEARVEAALDRTRAVTDPLTVEIGELGTLVKHLAETVAAHQTALDMLPRPPAAPPGVLAAEALAQLLAAEALAPPAPPPPPAPEPKPAAEVTTAPAPAPPAIVRDSAAEEAGLRSS